MKEFVIIISDGPMGSTTIASIMGNYNYLTFPVRHLGLNKYLTGKYKLNHPMQWNRNFWELIKVYKLKYTYTLPESIQNLDELYLELSQGDTKKRFDDIKKYRELIKKDINLNYPLFISGKVLNLLGADIHDNDIYFLDGTRRLLANILNDNKNNKVLIIDTL